MHSNYGTASLTPSAPPSAAAPELAVTIRSLDEHLSSDQSFASALARTVGAIAVADGNMTLAQFAAVTEIAGDGKASAVFTAVLLNAIEAGVTLEQALGGLARASQATEHQARDSAFQLMKPLLALQGSQARPIAQRVSRALDIRLTPEQLYGLPPEQERRLLRVVGDKARALVKGRGLVDAVADFGRSTGNSELLDHARGYNGGLMGQDELHASVQHAVANISQGIASYEEHAGAMLTCAASADSLQATAEQLRRQVQQRLALVDARIAYERRTLSQDIEDAVHDAGDAIELAIAERLDTGQWKDEEVWSEIAREQFGRVMEGRLDRVVRRKEEALDLLNHDLSLFQSDIRLTPASAFVRQHHVALARLMPRMRLGTRVANTVDTAANFTLMGSAMAAAGTGTMAYLFGVAVVVPAVAPAAPFVGGAVLLAGAFKWFSDIGKRKRSEIRDKRRAFEEELLKRLKEAELAIGRQLDRISSSFHESARQLLTPLLLEAEAAGRVQNMRKRIADKVITQARAHIAQLQTALAAAA